MANHSTETAVLKVLALDSGGLAMLTLLDPSADFDSVDHDTLLRRLQKSYDLNGVVMNRFASYLCSRLQHVRVSESSSSPSAVLNGVPQGLVSRIDSISALYRKSSAAGQTSAASPSCSRTIPRSTGFVNHQLLTAFARGCLPVLVTCRRG